MDITNQTDQAAAGARDVLADAAHVFLAAQQPVMVDSLRPRPAVVTAAVNVDAPMLPVPVPAGAPEQLMRELDDLADL